MILLVLVPLWLLMVVLVSALCRAARAGDLAADARATRDVQMHRRGARAARAAASVASS